MKLNTTVRQSIFFLIVVFCCTPFIDPPLALLLGLGLAQTIGNPFVNQSQKATKWLLKVSVVGLGFGMNLHHAIEAGKEGLVFTIFSIVLTLGLGWLLGRWLKVENNTSYLISSGTAICGGSAIAAVSPIINANEKQMSVALGTVFVLNSVALLLFPTIGHFLEMSQHQFGLWCAIAIHDTSSVVGAAAKYGEEALQVATTIKLERALWIIPLSIGTALIVRSKADKIKLPYFIGFFILAMVISTYFPDYKNIYSWIVIVAKKGLTITLFLIGAGLSFETIKQVGVKPLLQGILLWIVVSASSLAVIFLAQ